MFRKARWVSIISILFSKFMIGVRRTTSNPSYQTVVYPTPPTHFHVQCFEQYLNSGLCSTHESCCRWFKILPSCGYPSAADTAGMRLSRRGQWWCKLGNTPGLKPTRSIYRYLASTKRGTRRSTGSLPGPWMPLVRFCRQCVLLLYGTILLVL